MLHASKESKMEALKEKKGKNKQICKKKTAINEISVKFTNKNKTMKHEKPSPSFLFCQIEI